MPESRFRQRLRPTHRVLNSEEAKMAHEDDKNTISRRQVVGTAAIGAAGIAGGLGLGKKIEPTAGGARAQPSRTGAQKVGVPPGGPDEFFVFFSSGPTGEVRIF